MALGYRLNDFSDIDKFAFVLANFLFVIFVIGLGFGSWEDSKND
jgi:hypothetical protein